MKQNHVQKVNRPMSRLVFEDQVEIVEQYSKLRLGQNFTSGVKVQESVLTLNRQSGIANVPDQTVR